MTDVSNGNVYGWSGPLFAGGNPNSAEAILEDLDAGQGYNLAPVGTVSFSASSGNGTALNNQNAYPSNISYGSASATTGSIGSNGSFSVHDNHC